MVLELNLHGLTLQQIAQFVRTKCSEYGVVKSISISLYPSPAGHDKPFAVVEMSAPDETARLRATIGDGNFGRGVVVNLVQKADC